MKARVGVVQIDCSMGDVRANLQTIRNKAHSLRKSNLDIVCFPELATTGYSLNRAWRKYAEPIPGGATDELSKIAVENNFALICGVDEIDPESKKIYDAAILIDSKGRISGKYRKVHLWDKERKYFSNGSNFPVFKTPFGKIGIGICYDLEFPEPARLLALAGAELIFFPSAEFDPTGDIIEAYLRSRSSENCLFVAFANRIGSEGKTNFFGRSQIISPYHGVLSRAARGGVAVTELDFATLNSARRKLPYLNERLPKAYSGLVANS